MVFTGKKRKNLILLPKLFWDDYLLISFDMKSPVSVISRNNILSSCLHGTISFRNHFPAPKLSDSSTLKLPGYLNPMDEVRSSSTRMKIFIWRSSSRSCGRKAQQIICRRGRNRREVCRRSACLLKDHNFLQQWIDVVVVVAMFVLTELQDTLRVPPESLSIPLLDAITQELAHLYFDKVLQISRLSITPWFFILLEIWVCFGIFSGVMNLLGLWSFVSN